MREDLSARKAPFDQMLKKQTAIFTILGEDEND